MLKINLLNNKGLQNKDSFLDLPKIEKTVEKSPIIKSEISKENKQKFDEIKNDLDNKVGSGKKKVKRRKKKPIKISSILFVIFILLLGTSILYLYNYTNFPERIMHKISSIRTLVNEKRSGTISNIDKDEILSENYVDSSIAMQLYNKSKDLGLVSGVLELLPDNVEIIDFKMKNDNLSMICIVKDIISGENIKFFIYNHKDSFDPELFYIEKTEDSKNYQITSLTKLLNNSPTDVNYIYLDDKQLSGLLAKMGENFSLDIEPLTISKRDQSINRNGFIYINGSKSKIVNFCREISLKKINISFDNLEIKTLETASEKLNIELKIGITIFPKK